ncbi:MAG: EscU/YscU/HrcU family type III secretion system export apparatus switch protein [Bdellovibrionales bacterium]|nr:EscU/YscU/HrcU family type III secretion system export apparatus switch protein [Bdellovibrionales bacterium]
MKKQVFDEVRISSGHPHRKAAAIRYDDPNGLPSLLTSGEGVAAKKIIELAEQHGIPIHEDESLSALLDQIPAGEAVPDVAFSLIAEVLCFLYEMDVKWRDKHSFMSDIVEPQ